MMMAGRSGYCELVNWNIDGILGESAISEWRWGAGISAIPQRCVALAVADRFLPIRAALSLAL
jgi:hypothetical protein